MNVLPNTKELIFLDIEILTNADDSPRVTSHDNINVSISHEKKLYSCNFT